MVSVSGKVNEFSHSFSRGDFKPRSATKMSQVASDEIEKDVIEKDVADDDIESNGKKKSIFQGRQKRIFIAFAFVNTCSAMCFSIQAPFYPAEAEKKGVTPAVYGFVFGVFELVDFLACPVYGKFIRQIGPTFMLNAGNFVMAICCILFGFLDKVSSATTFTALSFAIRIIEALGQAGFITASYAIIAHEFPNDVAKAFSILETFFGVGFILGPSVGGLLYQAGGFLLPFVINGGILVIASFVTFFLLPEISDAQPRSLSITKLLRIPSVAISYYAVFAVSFSFGLTVVLLEPQLRQFDLSPALVGFMFVISGVTYALTAVLWGYLADKHVPPMLICASGGVLISLAFLLLGPAPYLPIEPVLWLEVVALVLHGLGVGAEYIASFLGSNTEAMKHGFPDNLETYGLISGLWNSGLALGSFLGPTISGVTVTSLGFRGSTQIVFGQQILVVILSLGGYWYQLKYDKEQLEESQKLLQTTTNNSLDN